MGPKRGKLNGSDKCSYQADFTNTDFTNTDNSLGNTNTNTLHKKGQVTVFIIAGLVILLVAAAVFFITSTTVKERLTAEGEPIIEAPTEFAPFVEYTNHCLERLGKQGLLLLGQQAGYIDTNLVGTYSLSDPTNSDGLNLESVTIPYWRYNVEPNGAAKIRLTSLQPKLTVKEDPEMSLEAQLARYLNENLDHCLDNYAPFLAQGFIVQILFPPDTQVVVTENNVQLWLDLTVKATRGETEHTFDQFFSKLSLPLKHYYDVASRITAVEHNASFLERQGMELVSAYSALDPAAFPPISEVTYNYVSSLSWQETILKEKFQQLLSSHVPLLRFLGSQNFYYSLYPEGKFFAQKIIDNMVLPLSGAQDLEVRFDYFGWEPYFKTNSEVGLIKPEHLFVKYNVLSFGQQRYDTHYDISYPILVTLHDDSALDGEGYTFTFALESNIRNNAPAKQEEVRERYPRRVSSNACNEEQRTTEPVTAVVVDSFSQEPLELVKIGFTIPNLAECEMGVTDQRGKITDTYPAVYGGIINFIKPGYLTSFYPLDTYASRETAQVIGSPAGSPAAGAAATSGTESATETGKVIELDKIVRKTVKVKKKELHKCLTPLEPEYTVSGLPVVQSLAVIPYKDISFRKGSRQCFFNQGQTLFGFDKPLIQFEVNQSISRFNEYYLSPTGKDLEDKEQAFLTLERVKGFHDELIGDTFVTTVTVRGGGAGGATGEAIGGERGATTEVELVPGIYRVTGAVTLEQPVTIPAEQRCFAYTLATWDKEECTTLQKSTANNYVEGSVQWDSPDSYLVITPDELYTVQEITLYVPVQDILAVPEQTKSTARRCAGWLCLPGVGCAGESCIAEELAIAARLPEDLQVPGNLAELSSQPELRKALEPTFS